MIGINNRWL